jgi:hypothetical protein
MMDYDENSDDIVNDLISVDGDLSNDEFSGDYQPLTLESKLRDLEG